MRSTLHFQLLREPKKRSKKAGRSRRRCRPGGRARLAVTIPAPAHPPLQQHLTAALAAFISSRNEKINTIEGHSSISLDRSTGVFIKAVLMLLDTQLGMGSGFKTQAQRGRGRRGAVPAPRWELGESCPVLVSSLSHQHVLMYIS